MESKKIHLPAIAVLFFSSGGGPRSERRRNPQFLSRLNKRTPNRLLRPSQYRLEKPAETSEV